ncbi:MAG: flippase [Lentisphaerae bacterium]|nr:MAG: flippase [Lentisphaerota bacterium]
MTVLGRAPGFLVAFCLKVAGIFFQAPLVVFAVILLFEKVFEAIGLILTGRRNGTGGFWHRFAPGRARQMLADSWPFIFSGLVIVIYMRIDQIMLGRMVGEGEVGIYSVAVSLAEGWYFIPMAVVSSTFPRIVSYYRQDRARFFASLQKLYNQMVGISYLIALPTTLVAVPLVTVLYGTEYARSGEMLALLVWGGVFTSLGVARSSYLTAENRARLHFFTVAVGCLLNVGLNFVLIPLYGGMGAVFASMAAYAFAAYVVCFFYPPLFRTAIMMTRALLFPKFW